MSPLAASLIAAAIGGAVSGAAHAAVGQKPTWKSIFATAGVGALTSVGALWIPQPRKDSK